MLGLAGDLFLGGVAGAQGHGHELADDALFHAVAVEPGLLGGDHVVLGLAVEIVGPRLAGHGVDLAGGDLDREGVGALDFDVRGC